MNIKIFGSTRREIAAAMVIGLAIGVGFYWHSSSESTTPVDVNSFATMSRALPDAAAGSIVKVVTGDEDKARSVEVLPPAGCLPGDIANVVPLAARATSTYTIEDGVQVAATLGRFANSDVGRAEVMLDGMRAYCTDSSTISGSRDVRTRVAGPSFGKVSVKYRITSADVTSSGASAGKFYPSGVDLYVLSGPWILHLQSNSIESGSFIDLADQLTNYIDARLGSGLGTRVSMLPPGTDIACRDVTDTPDLTLHYEMVSIHDAACRQDMADLSMQVDVAFTSNDGRLHEPGELAGLLAGSGSSEAVSRDIVSALEKPLGRIGDSLAASAGVVSLIFKKARLSGIYLQCGNASSCRPVETDTTGIDWRKIIVDHECDRAGLGIQIDAAVSTSASDRAPATSVVAAACSGPTSSWPDTVYVFDDADPAHPRRLGVLLGPDDGPGSMGLRVASIAVRADTIQIASRAFGDQDAMCCPSLRVFDTFSWSGGNWVRTSHQVS